MRELATHERELITKMHGLIVTKRRRNQLRTKYFEGKKRLDSFGISVPPQLRDFETVIGWPAKACTTKSRRIKPEGFTLSHPSELLDEIREEFAAARMQWLERQAIDAAVQHSVAFVFQSRGREGEPDVVTVVKDAEQATAILDPRTGQTIAALEMVSNTRWLLHTPGMVTMCASQLGKWVAVEDYPTVPGKVFCVPYIHGATLKRQFGQSRITRPVMGFTDMAVRTLLRQEVSAEFYSAPQRYMLGATDDMFTDEDGNPVPAWEAMIGALLVAPDPDPDENPDAKRVDVGEFRQMSMEPHSAHMRTIAMMFSGETSIPPGYLGIIQDNPESAEAKWASEEDLVSSAEAEFPAIDMARTQLAKDRVALLHGEWTDTMAADLKTLTTHFRSPSTPTQQTLSQAVATEVGAGILPATGRVTWERMGYSQSMIDQLEKNQREDDVRKLTEAVREGAAKRQTDERVVELAGRRGNTD